MNETSKQQQIENLIQKLQIIISPDTAATFISPRANITYITKQIKRENKKYTKEILNELTIQMIKEIKENTNNDTLYYFSNWQKDKFRYVVDDPTFQITQHQINKYVLATITGKHKDNITLDLYTIILMLFPLENKKKILNKHIWYSILLLSQAYFIICRKPNEA